MAVILGIHIGHHASCSVVVDGVVRAAIQQERLTKIKNDGEEALTTRLPILAALKSCGLHIEDCDFIVSSFQSVSTGSFGLHKPLIEEGFDLFDPFAKNHFVISHHLAHAFHTYLASPLCAPAVLVVDLAGSSTEDGQDFFIDFAAWHEKITSSRSARPLITESTSAYRVSNGTLALVERTFCVPHIQPMSFVWSPASLYSNVSRRVFGSDHADGQLMALAAYGSPDWFDSYFSSEVVGVHTGSIEYRNDWQHKVPTDLSFEQKASLAAKCQQAFASCIRWHASRALELSGAKSLAVAGGCFLNINANSAISEIVGHENYFVPSAPHDAGIAVGAALAGAHVLATDQCTPVRTDRLGPVWSEEEEDVSDILFLFHQEIADPTKVAGYLADGCIVARHSGRSEFGPRALGARSLLGEPYSKEVTRKLNQIKHRQLWRPVAPIVLASHFDTYFEGRSESRWMNFVHLIRAEYRQVFQALEHPDGTTRAQVIDRDDDPILCDILDSFARVKGAPVLVNTSLNGRGQPIIERASDALKFLAANFDVDFLLLDERVFSRRKLVDVCEQMPTGRLSSNVLFTVDHNPSREVGILVYPGAAYRTSLTAEEFKRFRGSWVASGEIIGRLAESGISESNIFQMIIGEAIELSADG